MAVTHSFDKNPTSDSPNCLRLVIGQSIAIILLKFCIMVLGHIKGHIVGAKLHRNTCNPRLPKSRENLKWGTLAELTKDSVTWVIAIPSVIFFPAYVHEITATHNLHM